jgi:hypothetical protein
MMKRRGLRTLEGIKQLVESSDEKFKPRNALP